MSENVAGGLLDVAARREEPPEVSARSSTRWHSHRRALRAAVDPAPRRAGRSASTTSTRIDSRLRRLNDLGFAVDEVRLEPAAASEPDDAVRMKVAVAGRRFHAEQLRRPDRPRRGRGPGHRSCSTTCATTGASCSETSGMDVPEALAARHWVIDRVHPGGRPGPRGRRRPRRSHPGLLRPAGGAVAAQRGGRPRRRRRAGARRDRPPGDAG